MPYELDEHGKQKRGFAAMTKETQREIASLGGKASHGGGRPKKTIRERMADMKARGL